MQKTLAGTALLRRWTPNLSTLTALIPVLSAPRTAAQRQDRTWTEFVSALHDFVESDARRLLSYLQEHAAQTEMALIGTLQNENYLRCAPTRQLPDRNFVFALPTGLSDAELTCRMVHLSQRMGSLAPRGPECMIQYANVFGYFLRPLPDRYEAIRTPNSHHIVVLHRGQFYKVTIVGKAGQPVSASQIQKAFDTIRAQPVTEDQVSIGPLTWLNQGQQASPWAQLRHDNPEAMNMIEMALFTVCLDDNPDTMQDYLVGPAENRLHHRTQLICSPAGQAFNIEHSGVDGTTWLRVVEELQQVPPAAVSPDPASVELLRWICHDNVRSALDEGQSAHGRRQRSLKTIELPISHPNLTAIKGLGVSPDAFVQVAMQLAYLETFPTPKLSYESINLRNTFSGARTAAGMPLTEEVIALRDASRRSDTSGIKHTLRAALKAHTERGADYRKNGSPYRMLQALRWAANQPLFANQDFPFLRHPILAELDDLGLSTSNCSSEVIYTFGFPPDGAQIGAGYRINGELRFCFTATSENLGSLETFVARLQYYIQTLTGVLTSTT